MIREDNKDLKRTEVYAYDNNGNRISSRRYGYTQCRTEELEEKEAEEKEIYSYDGDRLIGRIREENGQKEEKICVYDNLGNPTKYLVTKDTVSNNVRWSETRQLSYYGGTSFSYDVRGKRLQKGTKNYSYDREGRLLKQGEELEFLYDDKGVVGFVNAEGTYFYRKDILGNITGILDSDGKIVVRYKYDAWGNHVVLNPDGSRNDSDTFIGNINPFRYRGYYYDVETGLYYLKTRYYDPETGRFITIDDISYLAPDTINGLNLYAYCGNNPVMMVDPDGCAPKWWQWLLFGIGAALVIASVVVLSVATGGAATGLIGAIAVGAAKGALIGAAVGSVVGIAGGAIYAGVTGADLGQSILSGFLIGFGIGAIVGAVIGGMVGANGWYNAKALEFTNVGSKEVVLGRSPTYVEIAKSRGATYFHTTDDVWNATRSLKGVGNRGMWKINKAFLKQQIKSGANFILTAQPSGYFYAKEVAYVIKHAVYMFL